MSKEITPIAHRGASSYAPENTFAAFDLAVEMGIGEIEFDVHFTKDSQIIVIHDEALDRTTNSTGSVCNRTLEELQSLDAGSWFDEKFAGETLPALGDLLDRYKDQLRFHIEIQSENAEGLASRTCELVKAYGLEDRTTITSFWKQWLIESRSYASEIPTGWLVPLGFETPWDNSVIEEALQEGLTQICPRTSAVTPELVQTLHDHGFNVRCWGVYNEELMLKAIASGADAMTLNFPDKLRSHLLA